MTDLATATAADHAFMAQAIRLAERGLYTTDPNPRVGCVIVAQGKVVGTGWHAWAGEPHAEVHALREAGELASGATAYVTLEPCCHHGRTPPCTDALIDAGVSRVVVAAYDTHGKVAGKGIEQLVAAGVNVVTGPLEAEARELNIGFFTRHETGRPFVRVKLAASLDGRTALADGTSQWISGESSRADVQRWRARSSAILTGIGTLLADDPSLNVRLPEQDGTRQPARVIVDSHLRTPRDAGTLALSGDVRVFHVEESPAADALVSAGAIVECLPADAGRVSLLALLNRLAELDMNEVLVEAGSELNGALLRQKLVDEIIVFLAPHVLGDTAHGMFALPALAQMDERPKLELLEVRQFGADLRLRYRPV